MKLGMAVLLIGACLFAPAAARADSGSITNVHDNGDGTVSATYTSTSTTCSTYGFCGWFPEARQVPASQPCGAWVDDHLTYVGTYQSDMGTQTATDAFYPMASAVRICLHIYSGDGSQPLVAEYVYTAPTPEPTPTPDPTPSYTPPASSAPVDDEPSYTPFLYLAAAKARVPAALRDEHTVAFRHHRRFTRSCYRLGRNRVRCRVCWINGRFRYSGKVTLRNDLDDPPVITWNTTLHRKRIHKPKPKPPAPVQPSCEPGYSPCLKPDVSDYDCAGGTGDGPYYVEGPVYITGSDPYDLDRDGDGVACED